MFKPTEERDLYSYAGFARIEKQWVCNTYKMECKLCGKDERLLKKSHIIPEFMYKGLFDSKHSMVKLDLSGKKKPSLIYTGIYEKNILCQRCDNELLSKYESYAAIIYFGGFNFGKQRPNYKHIGYMLTRVEEVDYKKLKLFYMSVLWKLHITSRQEFKNIDVGDKEQRLRNMLLNDEPGKENEFKVITIVYKNTKLPTRSLIPPRIIPLNNHRYVMIHINNASVFIKLSDELDNEFFKSAGLYENNSMNVYVLENNETANKFFKLTTGIYFEFE